MTIPTEGIMCEISNNVILVYEFARLFDGFSIEYNALTQLTLGADVKGMICLAGLFGT